MADAGCGFGVEEIAGRRAEELHHRRFLERRGVRDVDDDGGAVEDLGQSLARERVDAGVRCGRYRFVAVLAKLGDELRADEPGSADDNDLHGESFRVRGEAGGSGIQLWRKASSSALTSSW